MFRRPDSAVPTASILTLLTLLPAAAGTSPGPAALAGPTGCGITERASVSSGGTEGDGSSGQPVISGDGRYVAFESFASNLVPGDSNGVGDVFVYDRVDGSTERVSVASDGGETSGRSYIPAISADGRFVAFHSVAPDLVPGDTNGFSDVFVHDRSTGITERVSVSSGGVQGNRHSNRSAISAEGRFVVFSSDASNLVPGDTNGVRDIFVHDRQSRTTTRASVASDGSEHNGSVFTDWSEISGNGRFATFFTDATNLVPGDTNGRADVFRHDLSTGTTTRASVSAGGGEGNNDSDGSAISADGQIVAFVGWASNLVPGDTNDAIDVFVRELGSEGGTTTRVSVADDGTEGDDHSSPATVSASGRYVAFLSGASNLVPDESGADLVDTFVHDRAQGTTRRASVASDCSEGNGPSINFGSHRGVSISADGRHVVFASNASNLVANDTNGATDIFVHTLPGLAVAPAPVEFGPVVLGATRGPLSVTVTNDSPEEVTISAISGPTGPFSLDAGTCGTAPFTLDTDEDCSLDFSFSPTTAGNAASIVVLVSDAPNGPSHPLTLRGIGSEAALHFMPEPADFGAAPVGETRGPLSVTMTNADTVTVEVGAVSAPAVPFAAAGGSCGETPFSLDPAASCTLDYVFDPVEAGSFSDVVEVTGDAPDGPASFGLQGKGLLHELTVSPEQLDFGAVPVGETGGPLSVTLSNSGNVDVLVEDVSEPQGPFTLADDTCEGVLSPGADCLLEYTFHPAVPGDASSAVTIAHDAPSSPDTVTLQGTGTGAVLEVDPDSLAVTLQQGASGIRALTLSNPGNETLVWEITDGPEGMAGSEITITHSESLEIESANTEACSQSGEVGTTTFDNQFLRTFTLADFDVTETFNVTEVTFGVQALTGDAPITVNLYTLDGELTYENLTLIGTHTEELAPRSLSLVTVPVTGTAPSGSTLVVEIAAPNLVGVAAFFPGSNGQGEGAPSYSASSSCGLDEPTPYATQGFPDVHLVMTVTGVAVDCALPEWTDAAPLSGSVPGGGEQTVDLTFDATSLEPGDYSANLCFVSNDPERALLPVPLALTVEALSPELSFMPIGLAVDPSERVSDGNGVFEPQELVDVVPTWRNGSDVAASLTGTATDFTGPEGADYVLAAGDADYGLIEAGAMARCDEATGVCYQVSVNDPAVRPATHWMATFDEALDDPDGTTQSWSLHIGDSFPDVPRESVFYEAIETLLHSGVTGGCTATEYCPACGNTRSQMAVFLVKAAEGDPDYSPPPCTEGATRFADVPAGNLFCPWIEELAARGVTSGCGGDNYCPSDAVTRSQMAVFLLRAALGGGYTPPECTGEFGDVPCPSPFAAWIEDLAERGITGGCAAGSYCPADEVTRGQMAAFVTRAFGLVLYGP